MYKNPRRRRQFSMKKISSMIAPPLLEKALRRGRSSLILCVGVEMSIVRLKPLLPQQCHRGNPRFGSGLKKPFPFHLNYSMPKLFFNGTRRSFCCTSTQIRSAHRVEAAAAATSVDTAVVEVAVDDDDDDDDVVLSKTFPLNWTQKVEGKMCVRLDKGEDENMWKLIVGCNLPGKWILHWGVTYNDDIGSEWDQPPLEMRPPGSISIKDYAIETPLKKTSSSLEGQALHEVQIDFNSNSSIAAINFVFKDEETGTWCQYRGRNFKVPLTDYLLEDANVIGAKDSFTIWPGVLDQMSTVLLKTERSDPEDQDIIGEPKEPKQLQRHLEAFYKELSIFKEVHVEKSVIVSVRKSPGKKVLHLETDLPGDVVVHWGVCRDNDRRWEIPEVPHPPETKVFKEKALRTSLQLTEDGHRSWGLFSLDDEYMGMLFVLKLNDNTWLNHMGNDFYVPLSSESTAQLQIKAQEKHDVLISSDIKGSEPILADSNEKTAEEIQIDSHTNEIAKEIRRLVTDISIEKSWIQKSKEAKENILQEIEKLAAEAYSMFRSSSPEPLELDVLEPPIKLCSGTGSGYEVVLQGFNWESHKSGRWYMELKEKATELSSLGFTIVWLPPPTDSVSPEGYMPRDLYDLNSRYGSMEELKDLVKSFHKAGLKVLGDAVLNHRCAQHQNHNGVWNIFGGKLNWDDRAVVADDEHFQGRGNKSSGESFHAAPNIDHSQDFVRKDLTEWLCWMRKEIGYDGWRLDFVRGFWGGYVKDYMAASEPYFAVGEYWDSLSYTYGEMDHNQDAHRQRIVDWINATSGSCGAFDVTTKGILHAALERCEYWRLSDQKGKPPGVVGWWPSRAVTFIENHDTGSTQGHWRFPRGKEMQGYAYILTHPGTPAVFYDHVFSDYHSELAALVTLRQRTKINCRSTMKITKADRDVYAAIVDEKVAMKIGPGHYEPPRGSQNWNLALEGRDYKVWEASQT